MSSTTQPVSEQLRFVSSKTGTHTLDDYLEAAERGTRTLSDMLGEQYTADGYLRTDANIVTFRLASNVLEYRVNFHSNPSAPWYQALGSTTFLTSLNTSAIGRTLVAADSAASQRDIIGAAAVTSLASYATLASPALTGTPTAPTAAVDTNTTQLASTAFVLNQAANAAPLVNGSSAIGASNRFARQDHVHPTDTTRAPLASPSFTGTPTAPTPLISDYGTRIATTQHVGDIANTKANLASPTFTGTPAAPTATAGTSTTQLATTAFVTTADALKANLASPTFTGTPAAPTATAGTSTTQLATTAFVTTADALKANLASPTFTGTVTVPTPTTDTGAARRRDLPMEYLRSSPTITGNPTWIEFVLDSNYVAFEFEGHGIFPTTNNTSLVAQLSNDGGATWLNGAADYLYMYAGISGSSTADGGVTTASFMLLSFGVISTNPTFAFSLNLSVPSTSGYHTVQCGGRGASDGAWWGANLWGGMPNMINRANRIKFAFNTSTFQNSGVIIQRGIRA